MKKIKNKKSSDLRKNMISIVIGVFAGILSALIMMTVMAFVIQKQAGKQQILRIAQYAIPVLSILMGCLITRIINRKHSRWDSAISGAIIAGLILIGTFIFKGSIFNVMILIIEFTIGWILSGIRLRRRGAFDFK